MADPRGFPDGGRWTNSYDPRVFTRSAIHRAIAVVTLLVPLAACGSDDKGSASDPRATVVDSIVARMKQFGFEADRACVADLVRQLDDADFALMEAATQNTATDATDPELSEAGEALGDQMGECLDQKNADSPLIDEVLAAFESSDHAGMTLDEDCARKQLGTLGDEQLQAFLDLGPDTTDVQAAPGQLALLGCSEISFGGEATFGEDVCATFDPTVLGSLIDGMGEGEASGLATTSGTGGACEFSGEDGTSVTVYVTRDADVAEWAAEATDGDGFNDGTEEPGVGDQAFTHTGYIGAATGSTLVELKVFPSFEFEDAPLHDVLVALLAQIAD